MMCRSLTLRTLKAFRLVQIRTNSSTSNSAKTQYEPMMTTSLRWLYNNDTQMALRRLDFDPEALADVAAKAIGATKCTEVEFVAEGGYNRVFRYVFSNGKDVIARIRFPNAGPRTLLTQSEVATMDFVRSRFGAPVPKVLAWDATTQNSVGCEYIIMEKCDGDMLQDRLENLTMTYTHSANIGRLMAALASIRFSQYGSIYYKEDVDPHLQDRPLYAEGVPEDESSERFRIGPTVERRFYRDGRAHMAIDRGPWKDINSYLKAGVDCELEWMRLHSASPHAQMQFGRHHSLDKHAATQQKWLTLTPAVLPPPEYCAATLSHPDIHTGNIFVTGSDPLLVSGFIDWQGASVRPLFETPEPNIFPEDDVEHKYVVIEDEDKLWNPVLPFNYEQLTEEEKEEARREVHMEWHRHTVYKTISELKPSLLEVLRSRYLGLMRYAVYCSSHAWSDGMPVFERALIALSEGYGDYIEAHSDYPVCPVVFSKEDVALNDLEWGDLTAKEGQLEDLLQREMKKAGITMRPDGAVDLDKLEAAVKIDEETFKMVVRTATQGRADKDRIEGSIRRRWPTREGRFAYSMESCL